MRTCVACADSEIEVTCDRVAFIKDGQVVASQDLRETAAAHARRVTVRAHNLQPATVTGLSRWATNPVLEADELRFDVASDAVVPAIVEHLVTSGANVFRVSPQPTSLEDVFVRLVGEDRGL